MSGWLKLGAYILAFEWRHRHDGLLLSEESDRWIDRQPILARGVIGAVGLLLTAHVGNFIPPRWDLLSQSFILWRR